MGIKKLDSLHTVRVLLKKFENWLKNAEILNKTAQML
jgi:hypothetical protein